MATVQLQSLSKSFDGVRAVENLDLLIQDGEFVTLLGPSGCGKSTTLACIAGLEEPTSGSIRFDGSDVTASSPRDRDIAMVFQDYALYPHMSVYDNLAFALSLRKVAKPTIDQAVRRAADMLGLGHLLQRRPAHLSGGQRQRVALGRAIVRNPVVFLMDEPLSNLDASLRVSTRTEIKRLQRELGTTTIFVTHDQEEAMVLSDRIAIMRDGRLQQLGTPHEIYVDPINQFVAGFIGSPKMNLLQGRIDSEETGARFVLDRSTMSIPVPGLLSPPGVGKVTLGVRPEQVSLSREGEVGVLATISLIEPVGAVTYADLELEGVMLKVSTDPELAFEAGERVHVALTSDRVFLFNSETGDRLRS